MYKVFAKTLTSACHSVTKTPFLKIRLQFLTRDNEAVKQMQQTLPMSFPVVTFRRGRVRCPFFCYTERVRIRSTPFA